MAAVTTAVDSFRFSGGSFHVFHITGAAAATAAATAGVAITGAKGISFHNLTADDDGGTLTVFYSSDDGVLDAYDVLTGTSVTFTAVGAKGVADADLADGYYAIDYSSPAGSAAKDILIVAVALDR